MASCTGTSTTSTPSSPNSCWTASAGASQAAGEAAGTSTVAATACCALTVLFESVAVATVASATFRDGLRARLRPARPAGVPVLTEAVVMIASYLTAERDLGRLAPDADVGTLAATLVGAGHLLFADRNGAPPAAEAVRKMVTAVIAGAVREPVPRSPASCPSRAPGRLTRMPRALIIGGTGATGRATASRAASAGGDVVLTGRDAARMPADIAAAGGMFTAADRADARRLAEVLGDGADLLVDCLCYGGGDATALLPLARQAASTVMISGKAVYADAAGRHANSAVKPRLAARSARPRTQFRPGTKATGSARWPRSRSCSTAGCRSRCSGPA